MSVLERSTEKFTYLIGTPTSIIIHTIFFIGIFVLVKFGLSVDDVLLVLTTAVSLEAIYLAIFIQMSVNRTTHHIADVKEDIGEIQEDVEDLQEDVDSLETSAKEGDKEEDEVTQVLTDIESRLEGLQKDIALLKKKRPF
jgi:uncharacterized membrane protein